MKTGLVIAGGGFMGIGPCSFLTELEEDKQTHISAMFDFFGGTSVGAILAAGYACGMSALLIEAMFRDQLPKIFGSTNWRYTLTKCGPKYDDSAVNSFLQKTFPLSMQSPSLKPVFIYSYNRCTKNAKVFSNGDNVPLWYAVRCSMAAPTYFAPVDGTYEDGGMCANDPAVETLAGIMTRHVSAQSETKILDLVTSGQGPEQPKTDPNKFITSYLFNDILPALTAGNSANEEFMGNAFLGSNYFRVQPQSPNFDLDAVNQANYVSWLWSNEYDKKKADLLRWLNGV
jgi:patatin-like phospholipase/acyl hydrolase